MSKRIPVIVKKNRYILQKLAKSKNKERKKMFKNAPPKLFQLLKTVSKMIISGKYNLGRAAKHSNLVRKIASSSVTGLKGIMNQEGGAFASILTAVLPLLGSLFSKLIK